MIFRHLDGLVTAPVAYALHKKKVLSYILIKKEVTLLELTLHFKANEGYHNLGLRVLCSQGFLKYNIDNAIDEIKFTVTDKSEMAFSLFHLDEDVVKLLQFSMRFHPRLFEVAPFERLKIIFEKYKKIMRSNYLIIC
jgi:hypothetical protein